MTATVLATTAAVCSAVLAFVAVRHSRRVNPPVRWAVDYARERSFRTLTVSNTGTAKARNVTVEATPTTRRLREDNDTTPRDVAPNGSLQFTLSPRQVGESDVESVTVRWQRLWFLRAHWSTSV